MELDTTPIFHHFHKLEKLWAAEKNEEIGLKTTRKIWNQKCFSLQTNFEFS